jgi:AbrB family looped-hinge helix DNA binding protein
MGESLTVKVSSGGRIVIPRVARERLGISPGDRLLVDVRGEALVLMRLPDSFAERLSGLYREVWDGVDVDAYIAEEREAWDDE